MKNVLIVDDSATVLMSLETILSKIGFNVSKASSGEEALAKYINKAAKFDLVITDLNMNAVSGIDLIKKARANAAYRFTPILMLTTESQPEKRQEAKRAGATGWLVKPINGPDLAGVIKKLFSS
ncbi:MAG: response regulator [Neomegalonema sp.]|nr:response regulator [Neomegalonema sp.]